MTNLYPLHILNLTNSLSIFQSCTVHIIFNQIQAELSQNYFLVPLPIPVVYSLHKYYLDEKDGHFRCNQNDNDINNLLSVNKTQAEFKFRSQPNPRLTCGATVIVDPVQCLKWENFRLPDPDVTDSLTFFSKKVEHAMDKTLRNRIITDSFYDPIYNTSKILESETSLYKFNWIWIHVEHQSKLSSSLDLDSSNIFFVLEHKTQLSTFLPRIRPVKLLYRLNVTKIGLHFLYTVQQTYIASYRDALKPEFRLSENYCELRNMTQVKNSVLWSLCVDNIFYKLTYMTLTSLDIHTQPNIHSLLISGEEPAKDLVIFVMEFQSSSVTSEWMAKESLEIITNSFMSELFKNSTVFYSAPLARGMNDKFPRVEIKSTLVAGGSIFYDEPFPLHFLSCTALKVSDGLSIRDFVSAFQWQTWLALFSSAIISGLFLNQINSKNTKDLYLDLTFVYNLLICQYCSAIKSWKWCFLPWLLAALIFSYSYQGENITRLCRSLRHSPIDSFEEILSYNFSIYSPGTPALVETLKTLAKPMLAILAFSVQMYDPETRINENVKIGDVLLTKVEMQFTYMSNLSHVSKQEPMEVALKRLLVKPKDIMDVVSMSEPSFIASQLNTCKSHVLVDSYDGIAKMYTLLRKLDGIAPDNLHISSKSLRNTFRAIEFKKIPVGGYGVSLRLGALVHSGLVELWLAQTRTNLPIETRKALKEQKLAESFWRMPKALSLKGNIAVVFYMVACFLVVPCIVFILELAGSIGRFVISFCRSGWSKVKLARSEGCMSAIRFFNMRKTGVNNIQNN